MTIETSSRKALANRFRADLPAGCTLYLKFGELKLEVSSNRTDIISALQRYYQSFLCSTQDAAIKISVHEATVPDLQVSYTVKPPEAGKTSIKEEYVDLADGRIVRKRHSGMVFVFGQADNVAIGPCRANLNQIINFINNRYIQWKLCQGSILGHAAGVILGGDGLALAGFSGTGKTTLALHLMNKNGIFVSNDRLMIEKNSSGLTMHGVAKMPRINPGTVLNNDSLRRIMTPEEQARFSELDEADLWDLEYKYDAPIENCFGADRFILSAPMQRLVLLNWKRNTDPLEIEKVNLAERRDLLPAFMKSVGLFFLPQGNCAMPEPTPETYIDYLANCSVWEIRGGVDFEKAVQRCLEL